jgi:hypothetical protein
MGIGTNLHFSGSVFEGSAVQTILVTGSSVVNCSAPEIVSHFFDNQSSALFLNAQGLGNSLCKQYYLSLI